MKSQVKFVGWILVMDQVPGKPDQPSIMLVDDDCWGEYASASSLEEVRVHFRDELRVLHDTAAQAQWCLEQSLAHWVDHDDSTGPHRLEGRWVVVDSGVARLRSDERNREWLQLDKPELVH